MKDYPGIPIKKGSTGDYVLLIQQRLHIQATGVFGPTTEEIVRQFQEKIGLTADGIVGAKTWAALFAEPVVRLLPKSWLPTGGGRKVTGIQLHWTGGTYKPNLIDMAHYHFLVDGTGKIIKGPAAPGSYLPHTRNFNTHRVGLSICAMGGAKQGGSFGKWPILPIQWQRAAQAAAEILEAYSLPVNERTLLTHSEVTKVFGIKQKGKWDIDVLPFSPSLPPHLVHEQFRQLTADYLRKLKQE